MGSENQNPNAEEERDKVLIMVSNKRKDNETLYGLSS
jgi:hypothetical protein